MVFYLKNSAPGEVKLEQGEILKPGKGELLVKVESVAQNPTDWVQNLHGPNIGSTVGYEFAGTVESLGEGVEDFSVGDRVAGFNFGNCPFNHSYGSYGEYAIAFQHITFKIPDGMSYDEAASLPTSLMVAAQTLYQVLDLPWPTPDGPKGNAGPLLIWGGNTAMGATALQFAKLSGAKPIVSTCSPQNFDYVKSLGADEVFDYNDPQVIEKIKKYTGDSLTKALDAGGSNKSIKDTGDCLGPNGGTVAILNVASGEERKDVKFTMTLTMTAIGFAFRIFTMDIPENPTDTAYMTKFWADVVRPLIAAQKIKPHRIQVVPGGLLGVREGWKMMQEGASAGKKLVYHVAETNFKAE